MVNHGNFLHSFLITIPSSTARELEKNCFPASEAGLTRKVSFFSWGTHLDQPEMTKKRAEANFSMVPTVQAGEFSRRKSTWRQ